MAACLLPCHMQIAVRIDEKGSIAQCELRTPGAQQAATSDLELLTGIAVLLEQRRVSFQQLYAYYDRDCDGKLSGPELAALAYDTMGPGGVGTIRYLQVGAGAPTYHVA